MRNSIGPVPKTREQLAVYFDQRAARFEQLGAVRIMYFFLDLAADLRFGLTTPKAAKQKAATWIEYAGCSIPVEERHP